MYKTDHVQMTLRQYNTSVKMYEKIHWFFFSLPFIIEKEGFFLAPQYLDFCDTHMSEGSAPYCSSLPSSVNFPLTVQFGTGLPGFLLSNKFAFQSHDFLCLFQPSCPTPAQSSSTSKPHCLLSLLFLPTCHVYPYSTENTAPPIRSFHPSFTFLLLWITTSTPLVSVYNFLAFLSPLSNKT